MACTNACKDPEKAREESREFVFEERDTSGYSRRHPTTCTVTYLSACGAPDVIFESRTEDETRCDGPDRSYVSYPVAGKHIAYDGALLHGCPAEISSERLLGKEADEPRVALMVNCWPRADPTGLERLADSTVAEMSNLTGALALSEAAFDSRSIPDRPYWVGNRRGRGELHMPVEHLDLPRSMLAPLPTGVFRRVLQNWRQEGGQFAACFHMRHPQGP